MLYSSPACYGKNEKKEERRGKSHFWYRYFWWLILEGVIVPIADIKGNVTLYGSGSTGYSYGKSVGAEAGVAIQICENKTSEYCFQQ